MPLPQNPNAEMEWINSTDFPITIVCEGYPTLTLSPNSKSDSLPLLVADNARLQLELSNADDSTVSNSTEINWHNDSGRMVVTQRAANLPDQELRRTEEQGGTYCMYLTTDSDNGGILIVGTIDIK